MTFYEITERDKELIKTALEALEKILMMAFIIIPWARQFAAKTATYTAV